MAKTPQVVPAYGHLATVLVSVVDFVHPAGAGPWVPPRRSPTGILIWTGVCAAVAISAKRSSTAADARRSRSKCTVVKLTE